MSRYYFHSENSSGLAGDADERDLADDAAAIAEGKHGAIEALLDELLSLDTDSARVVVTVKRSDGSAVFTITLRAEVESPA